MSLSDSFSLGCRHMLGAYTGYGENGSDERRRKLERVAAADAL